MLIDLRTPVALMANMLSKEESSMARSRRSETGAVDIRRILSHDKGSGQHQCDAKILRTPSTRISPSASPHHIQRRRICLWLHIMINRVGREALIPKITKIKVTVESVSFKGVLSAFCNQEKVEFGRTTRLVLYGT